MTSGFIQLWTHTLQAFSRNLEAELDLRRITVKPFHPKVFWDL